MQFNFIPLEFDIKKGIQMDKRINNEVDSESKGFKCL